jgi:hypothetical protein
MYIRNIRESPKVQRFEMTRWQSRAKLGKRQLMLVAIRLLCEEFCEHQQC